jgi:transposase
MGNEDIVRMSVKESRRYVVIEQVMRKQVTQKEGAKIIGVSLRQMQRMVKKVREQGVQGVIHGLRGQSSKRKTPEKIKQRILRIYGKKYEGFGPTFACEKLQDLDGISINRETLRRWLKEEQIEYPQRRARKHRSWRERKDSGGAMVQMDGSHHRWLEERGPALVLMAYIDDATNRVSGRFYTYEGTIPAMDSLAHYITLYGLPQSLYADRHDTYKSPKTLTLEEELAGKQESQSQFQRSVEELGIHLIHARSPQAKGRIERLFNTLQDRLVKEMRLAGISTLEQANAFLETYWEQYNTRFAIEAVNSVDLHYPLPPGIALSTFLCKKEARSVRKDGVVYYQRRALQILGTLRPRKVEVQEWLDGSLHLMSDAQELPWKEVFPTPTTLPKPTIRIRQITKPSIQHPWRKSSFISPKSKANSSSRTTQRTTFD